MVCVSAKIVHLLKFTNPLKSSFLLKINREIDVKNEIESKIKNDNENENEKKNEKQPKRDE